MANDEIGDSEKNVRSSKITRVLSPEEKQLIESINNGSVEDVKRLLAEGVHVDFPDEHGMTPLQHAAYKGRSELCELFLKHGADVNANSHEHGYTALMFGALSGQKDVVKVLLEHDACIGLENTIHRTATQLAAFVGQHEIVSLINNFFSRKDLEYYCQPHGLETEAKLPASLVPILYKLILIVNLNPVRLSMYLSSNLELLKQADRVTRVLDCLCEKMMKQRESNEILALKFSYLAYLVKYAAVSYNKQLEKSEDGPILGSWLRFLLRGRESDGYAENQEQLIRAVLKEFPYVECQLLQQMIRTITSTPPEVGTVTAVNVFSSCINGQRFGKPEDKMCSTCGELNAKTCHLCKSVHYCNKECQKLHWFVHKKFCKSLAEEHARQQENQQAQGALEPGNANEPVDVGAKPLSANES